MRNKFMDKLERIFPLSLVGFFLLSASQVIAESTESGKQQVNEADTVYCNGFIYTVDAVRSRAGHHLSGIHLRQLKLLKNNGK